MFTRLEPWHIIVLVIVFIALFGYKKLPDAARSVGRSMRILKAETKGLRGDDIDDSATPASSATAASAGPTESTAAEPKVTQPSTDQV